MNTSIDLKKDWKGYRKVSIGKMIAFDEMQALHIEHDKYLLQRLSEPSPHLTFKKYLASRNLGDLCDFYDSVVRGTHKNLTKKDLVLTGTIEYTTCLGTRGSLDTAGHCY